MPSKPKEHLTSADIHPNNSVTSVLLFSENPIYSQPNAKYTIRGVVRMQGYGDLTLEEKTITYGEKLATAIDQIRSELDAPKFGFINIPEAIQMLDGPLDNAVSRALRSSRIDSVQIINVFFKDGEIEVLKQEGQDNSQLLLN